MASNTFSLKIISANRVFFTGRCQSVIVPGYDGQKEVLAHHENMVIAVNEGEMRFLPEGEEEWQYAVVGIGFIEIVNNRVTLLVESVERPEEIDIARAQEAKERALEKIRQKQRTSKTVPAAVGSSTVNGRRNRVFFIAEQKHV